MPTVIKKKANEKSENLYTYFLRAYGTSSQDLIFCSFCMKLSKKATICFFINGYFLLAISDKCQWHRSPTNRNYIAFIKKSINI